MASGTLPLRLAFLGCGFITRVHSRHLRALRADVVPSYASRDRAKADDYCRRFNGNTSYGNYEAAIDDPATDGVVIAVPPRFHLNLALRALAAGKHVLVEKPGFLTMADYETVSTARDRADRVVLVGENDHYKPLAVCLRQLLADGVIGEMVFAHFVTLAKRLKAAGDWRNDERWPAATRSSRKAFTGCIWLPASAHASSISTAFARRSPVPGRTGARRA